MKECVLCKTRYQKGSGVTFHKFPTDIKLELWLKNIEKPSWRPKKYDYICSKHFSDDCFIKHNSCTTLKKCSIPTIFCSSAENVSSAHESMILPTPSVSGTRMVTDAPPVPKTIAVDVKRTLIIMDQNNTNLSGRKRRSTSCDPQQSIASKKARTKLESSSPSTHEKMVFPTPSVSGTRMVPPVPPVPKTIAVDVKRTLIMDQNNTNLSGRKRRSTSCDPQQSIASKKARSKLESSSPSTRETMVAPIPSVSGTRMVTPTPSVSGAIAVKVKRRLIMEQNNNNLSYQQYGTQARTLGHPEHVTPNFPSGDANSNTIYSNPSPNNNPSPLNYQQNKKIEKSNEKPFVTQSKASVKTEDDFDVNEYFARLQGTRYVSAPLNQNVNLEATEENLEEINLNEPEKGPVEVPQSLTADIAQNFSQLPQVLPQVASAVFSSFSSMLNMRSREQTPDERPGHQEVRNEATTVALMGVSDVEVKDVAPPPKEMNIGGTGNYRLTTKKKYAPIPGLSSGDQTAQQSYYVPNQTVTTQSVHRDDHAYNAMQPSYYVPTFNDTENKEITQIYQQPTYFVPSVEATQSIDPQKSLDQAQNTYMFNTSASSIPETNLGLQNVFASKEPKDLSNEQNRRNSQDLNMLQDYVNPKTGKSLSDITTPHPTSIIPPPPMFSNIQRRDENPDSVKSVLPPSVARRISANQPVIKPQATVSRVPENIFVPAPMFAEEKIYTADASQSIADVKSSAFAPFSAAQPFNTNVPGPISISSSQSASNVPMFSAGSVLPSPPSNIGTFSSQPTNQPPATGPVSMFGSSVPPPLMSGPGSILMDKPAEVANVPMFASGTSSVLPPPSKNVVTNRPMTGPINVAQLPMMGPPVGSTSTTPVIPSQISGNTPVLFSSAGPVLTLPPPPISAPKSFPPPPKNITPNLPVPGPTTMASVSIPEFIPINTSKQNTSMTFTGLPPLSVTNAQTGSQVLPLVSMTQANLPPPPTFFNPSAMTTHINAQVPLNLPQNIQQIVSQSVPQFFDQNPPSEPQKPIPEPPKATGINYRMTKKRPQYYSGPIEGVGTISNNIKPVIAPVETTSFHGALFTPVSELKDVADKVMAPGLEQSTVPFDINRVAVAAPAQSFVQPSGLEQSIAPFDISRPAVAAPEQSFVQPEYNTAFDFSRGTTESYDTPRQEPKGFGIIGSLKSKLSALDINKIQDSVTTFFDPAYKEVKNETVSDQDNVPYSQIDYGQNPYQYSGNSQASSNFEIVVPGAEQQYQPYNYQMPNQNQAFQSQNLHNYYENQSQTIPTSSYYSKPSLNASSQVFASHTETTTATVSCLSTSSYPQESVLKNVPGNVNVFKREISNEDAYCAIRPQYLSAMEERPVVDTKPDEIVRDLSYTAKSEIDLNAKGFFDILQPQKPITEQFNVIQFSDNTPKTEQNINLGQTEPKLFDVQSLLSKENPLDFFNSSVEKQGDISQDNLVSNFAFAQDNVATPSVDTPVDDNDPKEDLSKTSLDVSAPLFGLSSMLADKTKELSDLEFDNKETPKDIDTIFNRSSNLNFFDVDSENKPLLDESQEVPDLNICETCREVNKPEERDDIELDDLTTQLIENITSPIQLLNPVEVPLPENKTAVEEETDFDSSQCAEISHITEETIETIQVQSATELLEKDMTTRSYGWTDDVALPSVSDEVQALPNPIGFFVNPFDIPKNASDEIKAELKFTYEDIPQVIPVVPSAPPEEDSKSDETGIDVHSIEQDATKDFPFEEYVIEPSETDDDKIEREKSTEDIQEIDSFTNRVERFKKLEETDALEMGSPKFDLTAATSPYLPMPSYFDTGNYAAETHYRNSLTSPNLVSIGPDSQISVPPGFEGEYERRKGLKGESGENKFEPYIPETSTQTRPTFSPTYSTAHNEPMTTTASNATGLIQKTSPFTECVPEYSMFGVNKENILKPQSSFEKLNAIIDLSDNQKVFKLFDDNKTEINQVILKNVPPVFANPKTSKDIDKTETEHLLANIIGLALDDDIKPPLFGADITTEEINPKITLLDLATSVVKQELPFQLEKTKKQEPQSHKYAPLQDHLNFFCTTSEDTKNNEEDNSFNRLASYFSSPPKTDNSKSFFELSQGQDHYRRNSKNDDSKTEDEGKQKSFFELSESQNHYMDNKTLQDIPKEKLIANLNLMKELTSYQNPEFKPEHIIRPVNYFTVEYDNENLDFSVDLNKGDVLKEIDKANQGPAEIFNHDDKTVKTIVRKCKYCCNLNYGCILNLNKIDHESIGTEFKVKSCMDVKKEEDKKESDISMEKEGGTDHKHSVSVDFTSCLQEDTNEGVAMMSENRSTAEYTPVKHHWFYRVDVDGKSIWRGFSVTDNQALEEAYHSPELSDATLVPTDGGRFDVNVIGRLRVAVYWADKPSNVRRCSWFYKGTTDARYVPYTEAVAEKLEEEYRHGVTTGEWHRRLVLPNNELVVMHGPAVMVHFLQSNASDAFSSPAPSLFAFGKRVYRNPPKIRVSKDQPEKIDHLIFLVHGAGEYRHQKEKFQSTMRPRVVRRGYDESEIEDVEPSSIDHLLLLCHGVGSACDMRFRAVEEVVDDFRATSLQLIQSHYRNSYDSGAVGRVEVLPISWHATLHSGETGVDCRLARITLDSIPRLRSFTNDTVLDVLFYTSPVFCQTILDTVCNELNRIYKLFCERNPTFTGGVSLGGHSLGSVILYDLLCHQAPPAQPSDAQTDKRYVLGAAGTGQPSVLYPALQFKPTAMYALGSPIAIFECIRGVDSLGSKFCLPTCDNFFNIFHPYDPIAYRIEPLIHPELRDLKPQLIPHHKGRKRMHLELKDTMVRVGADIKQKLIESIKSTWSNMWKSQPPPTDRQLEKVVEEEMEREELEKEKLTEEPKDAEVNQNSDLATPDMLGKLNSGRRVDYVLQEAPFEMINEYLFAMSSHVCYWESEDVMLLMLREIYDALEVQPDSTVPQPNLTVQRTRIQTDAVVVNAECPSTSRAGT